ncbi:MAG: inorganic diphosphatase, partial [Bacteroidota bacterium]
MKYYSIYLCFFSLFFACESEEKVMDYSHVPDAFTVEIMASAGQANQQSFLPNIGNIGYLDETKNTVVLVLSESLPVGQVIYARPLGVLQIMERDQLKNVVVASPIDTTLRLSTTTNFETFITKNAGEKQIIQDWFLYQKGLGKTTLVGWENEK